MDESNIYKDIAKRTGGDVYIGVVGPVRTGKSSFIRRFIDLAVVPKIENEFDRERTVDQIPQSASGRTVMTTEPKFVPDEAVKIVSGGASLNVKLIDCVGYVVDGALTENENGEQRLVNTPWSEEPMPFSRAAEIGTGKVIREHSTIALLVTADGSFGEIGRESFALAEERIVRELTEAKKPFAIILNSKNPSSDEARELALSLEERYSAPCALLDVTALNESDAEGILSLVLSSFPVCELKFKLPLWVGALPEEHRLKSDILSKINSFSECVEKLGDVDRLCDQSIHKLAVDAGRGVVEMEIPLSSDCYYESLSEMAGVRLQNEKDVLEVISRLAKTDSEYAKIESALKDVRERGYGIVMPSAEELELEEPSVRRQAGGFGVRLAASANTLHLINAKIKAELCPVVGTEEQTEEVVKNLLSEYKENPERLWESNMFGKSLYDLVNEGMNAKLLNIPNDSREKIGETLERIVNEGANGLICILV